MVHPLCIPVDIKGDVVLDLKVNPEFLEIEDDTEVQTKDDVSIKGVVYRVQDEMIVKADISVVLKTFCALCCDPMDVTVQIPDFRYSESVDMKEYIDLRDPFREAILLEVPYFSSCAGTHCQNEEEIRPFLKKDSEVTYQPFKDL
jgi:hypothetical protein